MNKSKCECYDKHCPCMEKGHVSKYTILYRIDMEDSTGTLFCDRCANDALESGVFTWLTPAWEWWHIGE